MTLHDLIKSMTPEERETYARRSGTTPAYLYQLAGGHSKPSAKLAKRLADESNGQLTASHLLPEIFGIPATPTEQVGA